MKKLQFRAGETILTEGLHGDTAYLLTSGSVKVVLGAGAKAKQVATLDAGEVFGEMSLLEPGRRSASVIALTDVACMETTYDDFLASIQDQPEQAIVFMRTLVRRLRQTNEMMIRLDPRKRGLRELLADMQDLMSLESTDFKDEAAIRPFFSW